MTWKIGVYAKGEVEDALGVWPEEVAVGKRGHPICLVSSVAKADKRDIANARLIAAAPDLLAACRAFINAVGNCGYDCRQTDVMDAIKQAAIAINKSEGL